MSNNIIAYYAVSITSFKQRSDFQNVGYTTIRITDITITILFGV